MGDDDDVICLSSDDEVTNDVSPQKKSKIVEVSVKNETSSPIIRSRDLKRKSSSTSVDYPKKQKISSNGVIEEITIVSPPKTNVKSRPESKNNDPRHDEKRAELLRRLAKNNAVALERIPPKASPDLKRHSHSSSSSNHDHKSSRTGSSKISSNSRSSESKNSIPTVHCSKQLPNAIREVKNIFAKSSNSQSSSSRPSSSSRNALEAETRKIEPSKLISGNSRSNEKSRERSKKNFAKSEIRAHKTPSPSAKILQNQTPKTGISVREFQTLSSKKIASDNRTKNFDKIVTNNSAVEGKSEGKSNVDIVERLVPTNLSEKIDNFPSSSNSRSSKEIVNMSKIVSTKIISGEKLLRISRPNNDCQSNRRLSQSSSRISDKIDTSKSSGTNSTDLSTKLSIHRPSREIPNVSEISKISKIRKIVISPEVGTSKCTNEKNSKNKIITKIDDNRVINECSKSPEIEIVDTIGTQKSVKTNVEIPRDPGIITSKSSNGQKSIESSRKSIQKKYNDTRESGGSRVSSEKLEKHAEDMEKSSKSNLVKNDKAIVTIMQRIDNRKIDDNRTNDDTEIDVSKLPVIKNVEVVIKQIIPKRGILLKINKPKLDDSSTKIAGVQKDFHDSATLKGEASSKLPVEQDHFDELSRSKNESGSRLPVVQNNPHDPSRSKNESRSALPVEQNNSHDSSTLKNESRSALPVVKNNSHDTSRSKNESRSVLPVKQNNPHDPSRSKNESISALPVEQNNHHDPSRSKNESISALPVEHKNPHDPWRSKNESRSALPVEQNNSHDSSRSKNESRSALPVVQNNSHDSSTFKNESRSVLPVVHNNSHDCSRSKNESRSVLPVVHNNSHDSSRSKNELRSALPVVQDDFHDSSRSKDKSKSERPVVQNNSHDSSKSKNESRSELPVVQNVSHESSTSKDESRSKLSVVQNDSDDSLTSKNESRSGLPVVQNDSHDSSKSNSHDSSKSRSRLPAVDTDSHDSSRFKDESRSALPVVQNDSLDFSSLNDHSRTKLPVVKNNYHDSSRSEEESRTKSTFEPTPGCSKTPDEAINSKTSKSSGDYFEKPQLIERAREPVIPVDQDTFAMFLSLCLQTVRDPAMEKIIAKLKRNYELMDPEYARSRSFAKLLNEKRDRMMTKGRVYYYIGQVADEMKIRRKNRTKGNINDAKKSDKTSEDNETNEANDENDNDNETRRLRRKIKMIEKAMKKCAERINELEIAEVDFDNENNSNYIKLDRYKEKMVQLYTKMCEYTNEQAHAGRDYLRPKNLRVTQIPSIDRAINRFINSKLSYSKKKARKHGSFVDGLVFPDYVDILECVGKVNETENLGYDKRRQQYLAESAFTQLGKHLQEARQKDYWDTFSFELEKCDDPAAVDPVLSEKLLKNQAIAEKNTKEIFEEYVRKQEEGNTGNIESSSSDTEDENDDDENEENEENEENDDDENDEKKSDCLSVIDEISENEDESDKNDITKSLKIKSIKSCPRKSVNENVPEVTLEDNTYDNNLESSKKIADDKVNSSVRVTENSVQDEPMDIEVNLVEDVEKEAIEPVNEQRPLRIRSFAKPPSSWANSQEIVSTETGDGTLRSKPETPNNTETIDVPDEESSVTTNKTMEARVTSNSTSTAQPAGHISVVRLTNGNAKANITIMPARIQPGSFNAQNPVRFRMATVGAGTSQESGQIRQIQPCVQVRFPIPHNSPRTQILRAPTRPSQLLQPPQRPQVLRLRNGQFIRATTSMIRPLVRAQQPRLVNTGSQNVTGTSVKNPQGTTTLYNPRFVRIPGAAVAAAAARTTGIPQLRLERIENTTQGSQRIANSGNITVTAVNTANSTVQRAFPVLLPRTSNNTRPITTNSGVIRPGQKTWWLPPCKK